MSGSLCHLIFYRLALLGTFVMAPLAPLWANSISLPVEGPVPLVRPFASTPKPGTNPFTEGGVLVSGMPHPDHPALSEKLKMALAALNNGQVERCVALRNAMPAQSLDRNTVTWAIAVSDLPEIGSDQFSKAMQELQSWPGNNVIRRNFEHALARENTPPQKIIALFAHSRPVTADGMALLGEALVKSGQTARARAALAPWWYKVSLSAREEQLVLDKAGAALTRADHQQRLIAMLYNNRLDSARRVAGLAGGNALYAAFAAINSQSPHAGQKLAAVENAWKKQPIYSFAQIKYLRRSGQYEQAARLMLKAPKQAVALTDPDAWWVERRVLSREMLDLGKPKIAYQLAAAHAAQSPVMAADAEFHAGWYALRFLNSPKTAMQHFARIAEISARPISAARGYYWMARTAEALREKNKAHQYLQRAARYGTTFYGQLAASRLGQKKLEVSYPRPTPDDRARFAAREPVRAIKRLEAAGYTKEATLLYQALSQQLKTPGELALLAVMAERRDDHNTSLKIGKNAVLRGLYVGSLSHPLGAIPASAQISATSEAMAYAIARQESEFNPTAVSRANARGMLQLLPGTAKAVASRQGMAYSIEKLSNDPGYNAMLGTRFLEEQLQKFDGSYVLTFIGYNAGPRRAIEWVARYGDPRGRPVDEVVDWIERIPYTETRNYVQRVMENYAFYKARLTGTTDIRAVLVAGQRGSLQ